MTTEANNPSRRAVLAALAGTPAFVGTIGAAIAAPVEAETADDEPDRYELGCRTGEEIALCCMARAWMDRWQAVGGNFGLRYNPDGSVAGILRGMAMPYTWTPTDEGRDDLPPHVWLMEEPHQPGAVKVLEALLEMVPGLQDTVRSIAAQQVRPTSDREG